jgi:hypothetical protein
MRSSFLVVTTAFIASATLLASHGPLDAQGKKREAKAHEHGRGTLAMVIEGKAVGLEFAVPADDLVGFEHEAKTAAQKAAVAEVEKKLGAILSLVEVPAAAGCSVAKAAAKFEREEAEKSGKGGKHDHGHGHDHDDGGHAEFKATYEITCADPGALTSLAFPYFEAFPKAQALTVTIVTAKGQAQYEVSRGKRTLDLAGAI